MTRSESTHVPAPTPRRDPQSYFVAWLSELKQLHDGGMVSDEDYAYQRAERLAELLDCPRRRWLAWVYLGVPAGIIAALVSWRLLESIEISGTLAGIATLCGLAAIARRSREKFHHLDHDERLEMLRGLLASDVVTADEFLDLEQQLVASRAELSRH